MITDKLKKLTNRKLELLNELDCSLALQSLLPDVFANGAARTRWVSITVTGYGHKREFSLEVLYKGAWKRFKFADLPECLKATAPEQKNK